jgi:hypothetical protein
MDCLAVNPGNHGGVGCPLARLGTSIQSASFVDARPILPSPALRGARREHVKTEALATSSAGASSYVWVGFLPVRFRLPLEGFLGAE